MTDDSRDPASADVSDTWPRTERERIVAEIRAAVDAERWDDFGAIIDDYFFALSIDAPEALIEAWPLVPRGWLMEHPRQRLAAEFSAAIWRGAERVEERVTRTFTQWVLEQANPAPRDVLLVHAMDVRQHLVAGRFARANDAADDAQRIIRDAEDRAGFEDLIGIAQVQIGLARLVTGDLGRAADAFSAGWRQCRAGLPHPMAPYLAGFAAVAYALAGDNGRAAEWTARSGVPRTDDPRAMTYRFQFGGRLAEALVALGCLDRTAAETALDQVDAGIESGDLWWIGTHARARSALFWGDRAAALREIERSLNSFPSLTAPTSLAGARLRADASDLLQSLGELERASRVLEPIERAENDPYLAVSAARALMIQGRAREATELMDRAQTHRNPEGIETARWRVMRANLTHLARPTPSAKDMIAGTRSVLDATQAWDAAYEAIPGVRQVITADAPLPGDGTARIVPPPMVSLTPREEQVLGLLAAHASVQQIADAMFVSRNTAKTHLRVLYRKLGVSSREAALEASVHLRRGHTPRHTSG
ncbi:response regulator transcription factor [Microbacterium galbinum]|uniref:response regulator transcription factor n=1 Tax=Microbacterium galbinum TaxID=2851646 RepID=UPI001FFDE773|nr:LuxR family transcriptional regulator [Microbacterium galbinum]MCK2030321.1 LuxR C-terminal-related transcriptional regulator [Microbacterium galbinum]